MDLARDVCSATLRLRKAHGRRVRQPLADAERRRRRRRPAAAVRRPDRRRGQRQARRAHRRRRRGRPLRAAGRPGGARPAPRQADPAGHQGGQGGRLAAATATPSSPAASSCSSGEYSLRLVVDGDGASTPLAGAGGVVVLDTEVTPELEAEGTARDLSGSSSRPAATPGCRQRPDHARHARACRESVRRQAGRRTSR